MNLTHIYPRPMTMQQYIEWAKTSPDFDKAIHEVIQHELQDVTPGPNRILLAYLRCYEIAAMEIEKRYMQCDPIFKAQNDELI